MGAGLHEMRIRLPSRRLARVFLCVHENRLVALHAFVKKSQKTPVRELGLARKRQRQLETEQ